jgi:hypothetical protein
MKVRYRIVGRNIAAENAQRRPCKIAMVHLEFENGHTKMLAIDETMITTLGPDTIENEVKLAAAEVSATAEIMTLQ